jgi:hypothetical protein
MIQTISDSIINQRNPLNNGPLAFRYVLSLQTILLTFVTILSLHFFLK